MGRAWSKVPSEGDSEFCIVYSINWAQMTGLYNLLYFVKGSKRNWSSFQTWPGSQGIRACQCALGPHMCSRPKYGNPDLNVFTAS